MRRIQPTMADGWQSERGWASALFIGEEKCILIHEHNVMFALQANGPTEVVQRAWIAVGMPGRCFTDCQEGDGG